MQESLVSVNNGTNQLRLSGGLSEWLFSSKFWSNFNAQHGTMFDQFEEDEVNASTAKAIIEALNKGVRSLEEQDKNNIEFVYRWTPDHKPLTTSIPKKLLLSELIAFREFLADAVARDYDITSFL